MGLAADILIDSGSISDLDLNTNTWGFESEYGLTRLGEMYDFYTGFFVIDSPAWDPEIRWNDMNAFLDSFDVPTDAYPANWSYFVLLTADYDWYLFKDSFDYALGGDGRDGLFSLPRNFEEMAFVSVAFYEGPTDVPEPGSLILLGTGILGLGYVVKRRRMNKK